MKKNSILAPLVYHPGRQMSEMLNDFIQSNVFVPEEDPEDENEQQDDHTKIEALHKRRNFLACFCKLIVYNVLPTKSAADVFKHYLMFYNDYGESTYYWQILIKGEGYRTFQKNCSPCGANYLSYSCHVL